MHKRVFVISFENPFSATPFIFCSDGNASFICCDIIQLLQYRQIIAYNFEICAEVMRNFEAATIPTIIDIVTMKKLVTGQPKKQYANQSKPWDLNNILENTCKNGTNKWISNLSSFNIIEVHSDEPTIELVKDMMERFVEAYRRLLRELRRCNELRRFFCIEIKIYNIFFRTSLNGIHIDQVSLHETLQKLRREYYTNINILELNHGFVSQRINNNLSWDDISEYTGVKRDDIELTDDLWRNIELLADDDPFLSTLYAAKRTYSDYNSLLRYAYDKYYRIFPYYDVMGTVTGRILISNPGIQYIKKENRNIFVPREGYSFIYADYKQYEPGILASLANDEKLIELYNQGDVYKELSVELFGDASKRKLCKTLFLSYLYGMSINKIGGNIERLSDGATKNKGLAFFQVFHKIAEWKDTQIQKAVERGYSESLLGNRRYIVRQNNAQIETSCERWIPNQIIQGTASLIFKKALIAINDEFPEIEFLIPMHDAILLEIRTHDKEKAMEKIREIMIATMQSLLPNIKSEITFETF